MSHTTTASSMYEYYAKFADGMEITYTTDCHITSSRIWASVYFGRKVAVHGLIQRGQVWTSGGAFDVPKNLRRYEFTPKFSEQWIKLQGPGFDYRAEADRVEDEYMREAG